MAFGHAVKRGGFDEKLKIEGDEWSATRSSENGDEQIKGSDGDDIVNGHAGDDVIIGRGGDDKLVGGDGEDDLSGGEGNDILVGGILEGDTFDTATFTQDDFSDDYNAAETFEQNGTDTVIGYDADDSGSGVVDVIDFSDTFDFVDPTDDGVPTTDAEKQDQLGQALSYDAATGKLSDAGNPDNVWFNVYGEDGITGVSTVYAEVDGDVFQWSGSDWQLQSNFDMI